MKLTIDIGSAKGIDAAIAFLKTEMSKDAMQEKADKIASVLIGEGVEVARSVYSGTGVQVTRTGPTAKGEHKIFADDPEIAFIEFGVGWGVDAKNEFAKRSNGAPPVYVGSWSERNVKPDGSRGPFYESNYDHWYYNGERLTGAETDLLPKPGMETARQYITDERVIAAAAKEALEDD